MTKDKKIIGSVIVCAILIIVSFYGGMVYARKNITAANTARQNQFNQNFGGRSQGMRNGAGGGLVSGQILSKDDKSVTVKLHDGGSKIVFFSPSTKVEKTVDGVATDLATGKEVMVTGTANPDGSVSATSIQIRPILVSPTGNTTTITPTTKQ